MSRDVLAFSGSSSHSYIKQRDFLRMQSSVVKCDRVVVRETRGKRKKCIDLR